MVAAEKHPKAGKKTTGKLHGAEVCSTYPAPNLVSLETYAKEKADRTLWDLHFQSFETSSSRHGHFQKVDGRNELLHQRHF